jgi:hypothetical protein
MAEKTQQIATNPAKNDTKKKLRAQNETQNPESSHR